MTRREERKLCAAVSIAAGAVARPGLNYAELYMARLQLRRALEALIGAATEQLAAQEAAL